MYKRHDICVTSSHVSYIYAVSSMKRAQCHTDTKKGAPASAQHTRRKTNKYASITAFVSRSLGSFSAIFDSVHTLATSSLPSSPSSGGDSRHASITPKGASQCTASRHVGTQTSATITAPSTTARRAEKLDDLCQQ